MRTKLLSILTVCLIMAGMISCDVTGEQNYDFEVGDSLNIVGGSSEGPIDTLFVPHYNSNMEEINDTTSYYSKAFTINKDYAWSVTPDVQNNVRRDGEYIDIITTSDDAGSYTITVDDGEYQGETTLVVVDTTATE